MTWKKTKNIEQGGLTKHGHHIYGDGLCVVRRAADVAAAAGPVGVHKLAGVVQQLVRVRPKVVALRLSKAKERSKRE